MNIIKLGEHGEQGDIRPRAQLARLLVDIRDWIRTEHEFSAGDLVQVKAPFADMFEDLDEGEPLLVIEVDAFDPEVGPMRDDVTGALQDIRLAKVMGCGHLGIMYTDASVFEPYDGEIAATDDPA